MLNFNISDIKDSLQIPALIKDEFARKGNFEILSNGNFVMYVGGFTAVFPFVVANVEQWAFGGLHIDLGYV